MEMKVFFAIMTIIIYEGKGENTSWPEILTWRQIRIRVTERQGRLDFRAAAIK